MISLMKNEIEGITVELTVEESIKGLGGYPTLLIGECPIESVMIHECDTLQVIKAIANSSTLEEFKEWIGDEKTGIWKYSLIRELIDEMGDE